VVTPLSRLLLLGTLPGVVVGAVVRVRFLSGEHAFSLAAAVVLAAVGLWLVVGAQRIPPRRRNLTRRGRRMICAVALGVGVVGGVYGIGGGSLLAPILIATGLSAYEVAPATLAATFVTSVVGIASYQILQLTQHGSIAPDWPLGAFLGIGGFCGSYLGARLQRHLPETALRRLLGVIACLVAARYVETAVATSRTQRDAAVPTYIA
jgi:uncharacterized membrane protein YfcA